MIIHISPRFVLFILLSLTIHMLLLLYFRPYPVNKVVDSERVFKIKSIDTIEKKGDLQSLALAGPDQKSTTSKFERPLDEKKSRPNKNNLQLSDLAQNFNYKNPNYRQFIKKKPVISSISHSEIKNQIQSSPEMNSTNLIKLLDANEMNVSFGIPNGIKEDELNTAEMVFYSFKKRLVKNYVSTFFHKLNEFELQNPHKKFPMTDKEQLMTGQVTYDAAGNIIRIKMVRWSEQQDLQDFFLEVLGKLGTLPNPPEEILDNGEFVVFYTLNIRR
jgi:hypothetical protein